MDKNFNPVPKPSHNRRVRKQGDRNKFPKEVRDQIKEHFDNTCQMCGNSGVHIHHVRFRSQGGRGVFTNGLLLCNSCDRRIHDNHELNIYWKEQFLRKYGPTYYMDEEDKKHLEELDK